MKQNRSTTLGVLLTAVMLTLSACGPTPARSSDAVPAGQEAAAPAQVQAIAPAAYQSQFVEAAQEHLLVDVRTPEEYASGHIPGSVNIPLQEIDRRLGEIPADSPVVVYCRSGNRSAQAADILRDAGYSQIYDLGGIGAWQAAGLPVQQ